VTDAPRGPHDAAPGDAAPGDATQNDATQNDAAPDGAAPEDAARSGAGRVVFHGPVEAEYSRFYLRDRAYRRTLATTGPQGLVTVRPCELVLATGTVYGPVGCTVVVSDDDPGAELDRYEDVEEVGFVSATGVLALTEWGRDTPRAPDIVLPAGPGGYRLRYHARHTDLAAEPAGDAVVDDYLVQIWPSADAARSRPKLTSAWALPWAGLETARTRAAAPPVPEGVVRAVCVVGNARVTESLPADVASTYWSHLVLRPGDHVRSRRAWLVFRADGDLVVYDEDARIRWASGTAGRGDHARFQIDGDFVVYNAEGGREWASGTHGYEGNFLAVQDDGNVVIYRADGNALWSTGTNH
jgi:hypothetical protein